LGALSPDPTRGSEARHLDAPRFPEGRVGLVSDTHGLLRPEALSFLQGCQLIVHAGDIGGRDILDALCAIAPVIAVRGNNDTEPGLQSVHEFEYARIGGVLLYVVHDRARIAGDPHAQGVGVVVTGHSHKPLIEHHNGVLFVNPGSAGRRRFTLPIAIGELRIEAGRAAARIVDVMDGSVIAAR
jgi:putative phosphoesterase